MKEKWKKLEDWLKVSNPMLLADLNPAATDDDIRILEEKIGVQLPTDFVECLKIHNGQKGSADGLFSGMEFLSSQRILDEWKIWKNLMDRGHFEHFEAKSEIEIQNTWWNPRWIPFTSNGAGDHLCLDLAPTDRGQLGQIITVWHDDGYRKKNANSFAHWFMEFFCRIK